MAQSAFLTIGCGVLCAFVAGFLGYPVPVTLASFCVGVVVSAVLRAWRLKHIALHVDEYNSGFARTDADVRMRLDALRKRGHTIPGDKEK